MPMQSEVLFSIWTITENPRDFPGLFVARRNVAVQGGSVATDEAYSANDIEPLRAMFREAGLVCIPRDETDDPVIVESWI